MSEPALDLAAIREWCAQEMDDYTTSTRRAVRRASCEYVDGLPTHSIRSQMLRLVDELERVRAERDALHRLACNVVGQFYQKGTIGGDVCQRTGWVSVKTIASWRAALGEVTQ